MGGPKEGEQIRERKEGLVVIIMGSDRDLEHAAQIGRILYDKFGIKSEGRVASAHKTPEHVLEILRTYDAQEDKSIVYIAVAGKSNALGGVIDGETRYPVFSCPPPSDKFGGADVFSSLRAPSGISGLTALEPEGAAFAAAKDLALNNPEIQTRVEAYQRENRERIIEADKKVQAEWEGLIQQRR